MRPSLQAVLLTLPLLLLMACSSDPAHVEVIGADDEVRALAGEWTGTYESPGISRIGSISFHLTDNPEGAHGDVLMVPKEDFHYALDDHGRDVQSQGASAHDRGPRVLSIEFVRVVGGTVTGKIGPYPDPDMATATLETYFTGRRAGDRIEGTFVTYSSRGPSPRYGSWRVFKRAER